MEEKYIHLKLIKSVLLDESRIYRFEVSEEKVLPCPTCGIMPGKRKSLDRSFTNIIKLDGADIKNSFFTEKEFDRLIMEKEAKRMIDYILS